MSRNVNDIIRKLGPEQRKHVETRAAQLVAEEMTRSQLRKGNKFTPEKLAKSLRIDHQSITKSS